MPAVCLLSSRFPTNTPVAMMTLSVFNDAASKQQHTSHVEINPASWLLAHISLLNYFLIFCVIYIIVNPMRKPGQPLCNSRTDLRRTIRGGINFKRLAKISLKYLKSRYCSLINHKSQTFIENTKERKFLK